MDIKIINKSDNPNPSYATEGSAGMDIRAFISEDIVLKPSEIKLIPTGIANQGEEWAFTKAWNCPCKWYRNYRQ